MKRRLTSREMVLLGILVVLMVISAYILWFYTPVTERIEGYKAYIADTEDELLLVQARVEEKRHMEHVLEEIFSGNEAPLSIAPYDNLKQVMFELNGILSRTQDYTLNFGTVDTEESIVRRSISMHFSAGDYASAQAVLQALHDSQYRCMLDDVTISMEDAGEPVSVDAVIVFFEYQQL